MNELHLTDAVVGYRDRGRTKVVLDGVTLVARPGELTALIGPNGSGKSTLLRSIAGLQPFFGGSITLGGASLSALSASDRARLQAVVLTERVAPGILTARELVGLGRHPHTGITGRLTARDWEQVDAALTCVGAGALAHREVSELSDGERQRVMTARALAQEPRMLLMDEPSAFLDAPGRVSLTGMVGAIAAEQNRIVILSTHEVELVLRVADWVWLVDHDGTVRQGRPEELVLDGEFNRVFDSPRLLFNPDTLGFELIGDPDRTRHLRVGGDLPGVVLNLITRRGWQVVDGPAELELVARTGMAWEVRRDGRTHRVEGIAALDATLRAVGPAPRIVRVGPADVTAALRGIHDITPYFAVGTEPATAPRVTDLSDEYLRGAAEQTCARIGATERRVGTATWHMGLVARLWSVTLGAWATAGIVPDLADVRWADDGLVLNAGGWLDTDPGAADTDRVADLVVHQVMAVLGTLHDNLVRATGIARGLLIGNAAAAVTGAARALGERWPEPQRTAMVDAVLGRDPLAGAVMAPGADGERRRRSCCLFYRTARGGYCGDCAVNRPSEPTTRGSRL